MTIRQYVVITEAELKGLMYGQSMVTEISTAAQEAESTLAGVEGFIDALIEQIERGEVMTVDKLKRVRESYIGLAKRKTTSIIHKSQLLWRAMQDEENKKREQEEISRGQDDGTPSSY